MFLCSVFKSPLLDAGIMGAGDEGMTIDPGQVTNMVQPMSVCRHQSREEPHYSVSLKLTSTDKFNLLKL